jgi:hypothetical protein
MKRVKKIVIGTVDLGTTDEREDTAMRIVHDAAVGDCSQLRWIAEDNAQRMEEKRLTPDGIAWCFVGRIYY